MAVSKEDIGKWVTSFDKDVFDGTVYDTKEDALKDMLNTYGGTVYIGRLARPKLLNTKFSIDIYVDEILEQVYEQLSEHMSVYLNGDRGDVFDITEDEANTFQVLLSNKVADIVKSHAANTPFQVVEIESWDINKFEDAFGAPISIQSSGDK
jgi:hypothetical protein